jgi:hypothetical protein
MKLTHLCPALAAVLLAVPLLTAAPVPEKDVKAQALALNDLTGDDAIQGQVRTFVENPESTKSLLSTALTMAKEKDQPFNYNALYVLARTAGALKEYDQSVVFYKKARDKAEEL